MAFLSASPETIAWISRTVLGLSFVLYGIAKLRDVPGFVDGAVSWRVLDPRIVRPLARLLPFAEFAVGAALLLGLGGRIAEIGAILILGVFAAAVLLNLIRGLRVPCFCAGAASEERIGVSTLLRIGVLGLLTYVVLAAPAAPTLPSLELGTVLELTAVLSIGVLIVLLAPFEVAVREVVTLRKDRRAVRAQNAAEASTVAVGKGA